MPVTGSNLALIPVVASAAKKAKEIVQAEPLYCPGDLVVTIPDWLVVAAAVLLVLVFLRWKLG